MPPVPPDPAAVGGRWGWLTLTVALAAFSVWAGWLSPGTLAGIAVAEALRAAATAAPRRRLTPPDNEQECPPPAG